MATNIFNQKMDFENVKETMCPQKTALFGSLKAQTGALSLKGMKLKN